MKTHFEESRSRGTHRISKLVACENLWRILARYLLDCHVCAPKCHFPAILAITFTCWCAVSTLPYFCANSRSRDHWGCAKRQHTSYKQLLTMASYGVPTTPEAQFHKSPKGDESHS